MNLGTSAFFLFFFKSRYTHAQLHLKGSNGNRKAVCVRACVCVCVCVRARTCVSVCLRVRERERTRLFIVGPPACKDESENSGNSERQTDRQTESCSTDGKTCGMDLHCRGWGGVGGGRDGRGRGRHFKQKLVSEIYPQTDCSN